jgi:hypothetical protein
MTLAGARHAEPAPRAEHRTAVAVVLASFALRLLYAEHASFDTDEPQHLHVVWLWSKGLVGYRDFFDNHTPLFHWLAVPLVRAVGERPELLIWARHAMLPIVGVLLYAVHRLATRVFSRRVALWTVATLSVFPSFVYDSIEFRPDVAWAALWIGALAVLLGAPSTVPRALAVGAAIGTALAISVKTIFLVPPLVGAIVVVAILEGRRPDVIHPASLAALVAGFAVVAGALVATLHHLGALSDAYRCLVAHNASSASLWSARIARTLLFVVTFPVLVLAARRSLARAVANAEAQTVLLLVTGLYYTTLNAFVPLVPTQTLLPFYPTAVLVTCGFGLAALDRRPGWQGRGAAVLGAVAVGELALVLLASPPLRDRTRFERALVADVLRLTGPNDTVMDLKGESLFRRRPVYAVLENVTEERIRRGDIVDDIADRMISAGTFVAVVDSERFPPAARRFLNDNYVPVGHLRVAGKFLVPDADGTSRFEIVLPGRYAIVSPFGSVAGILDGEPFEGSRALAAGAHRFRRTNGPQVLGLVWADAVDAGYSPFHPVSDR